MIRLGGKTARGILACVVVAAAQTLVCRPLAAGSRDAARETAAPDPGSDLAARLEALEALVRDLKAEIARLRAGGGEGARIAELEKRIEALSRELEEMRIGEAAATEPEEPVPGLGPAASRVYHLKRGVSIGGYGEMLYQNFASRRDDGGASGSDDRLDFLRGVFYIGYKFNDRLLFNSEVEVEHAFVEGDEESGEVALEFAYLDFRAQKGLGLRGGLLLIPMGFTNELHEPPVFLGARRPEVERLILPTTWRENGAGIYGELGPVTWRAYIVASLDASGFDAGSGVRGGRQAGSESIAEDFALTARFDWTPRPGLLFGGSGYAGDTAQGNAGIGGGRLVVWDARLEWAWRGLHVRGLYARASLDDAAAINAANMVTMPDEGVGSRLKGYYGEIGWNVLGTRKGSGQELTPFVRYESLDTQAAVPAGFSASPANDRTFVTYGLRYRPIPNVAFKLDYLDAGDAAGTGLDQVNFALGYLF